MTHIPLKLNYYIFLLSSILLLASCGGGKTLRGILKQETPYERYTSSIMSVNLHQTALGRTWIEAGRKALLDSIQVDLPFRETGYFAPEQPRAVSYRFHAQRGERVVISLETTTRERMQMFMDLYKVDEQGGLPSLITYADTSAASISYEVQENMPLLLRLQPELLRGGQYTVTMKIEPSLAFPVPGKSSRNISSVWGDPRDAGARRHEGVDIFAPRGTPVVASASGIVRGVSNTSRGGKVVWLLDTERRQSMYYAHLDSQLVSVGQQVQAGDTIGLIGNTGNAKGTAPHLHFGIYRFGEGATNPYPYLHRPKAAPAGIKGNLAALGSWRRISSQTANLRLFPSIKGKAAATVSQHTPIRVVGATANWYRVLLPDGFEGYVAVSVTETITRPLRNNDIARAVPLLDEAHPLAAPKDTLSAGENVAVLANYKSFSLVQLANGNTGWIPAS